MSIEENIGGVDSNTIFSLSIPVSEKISNKHLTNFLKINISNNNININKNTFYYLKYLESSKTYEITIFNDYNIENFIFEPFFLLNYYNNKNIQNSNDLFITNSYFALFINKEFITYKTIKNESIDDIIIYLSQSYNISIDNTITIKDENFKLENGNRNYNYKTFNKNNSFKIFLIYLFLITLIFGYLIYEKLEPKEVIVKQNKTNSNIKNQRLEKVYQNHKNRKIVEKTIKLFKYLKINKITIEELNIKNKICYSDLISKDKSRLFDILTIYNKTKIISINFDKDRDLYIMRVEIKL